MKKNQKGVTLITLAITIVILLLLTFTITNHIGELETTRQYSNFQKDINRLNEAVSNYYANNKELPIRNKYANITMFEAIKNPNDGDSYYVLDLEKLNMDLKFLQYGKQGYGKIKEIPQEQEIGQNDGITDVYVINEETHTIYYPEGVDILEKKQYRLLEKEVELD